MLKKAAYRDPYLAALLLILALNAVLKWRFFSGLCEADDFSYGVYAYSFGRIPLPWDMSMDFRVLRVTLLMPVALLFRFLPPVETVAVLYPMLVSFGTVALAFLIGRKLYGVNAGLIAAFVLATFPGDVVFGTMLLPDIVVPFYIGLAVLAFVYADDASGRRAMLLYAASGVALFLAFTTRENTYNFALFFLPFAFDRRRWENGLWLVAAGFAAPLILLYGFYWLKSGDFLFNLHLAQKYREPLIESGYIPDNSVNWYVMLFYMLPGAFGVFMGRPFSMSSLYGITFYAGILCVAYTAVKAWRKRDYRLAVAPWWFLLVYLYLEFGTVSFTKYQMMKKLDRFLLTLTPAMAMCYGVVLADAWGLGAAWLKSMGRLNKHLATGVAATLVMVIVLYTSFLTLIGQKADRGRNMAKFRWGYREVLAGRPNLPVYTTGGWWENKLSFYYMPDVRFAEMPWRRSDMLLDLKNVGDTAELAGSHVIIDRSHFSGRNDLRIKHSYDDFGSFVRLPPEEWTLLGRREDVEIYSVPEGWRYEEPDGKDLARRSFLYSIKAGDFPLFLYNLDPGFVSGIGEQQLSALVRALVDENNPLRNELLNERLLYTEHEGHWKIMFNLE
ncbi:MAG: glycosyltransferase family 39 protein [Candidatus Latescibacteria bacterium]|nr:glycosyltransferase family 39 protein [Candidatus Latescibacterota bacterium]